MKFSVYRKANATTGVVVGYQAILSRIREGGRGLEEKTRTAQVLAQTDVPAYKKFKDSELPAVAFSGVFPARKRKAQFLSEHSGCVVIDIDGLDRSQMTDLLVELSQLPHVLLAFVSPSGAGIKIVLRVSPVPLNDTEHKGAYAACLEFLEPLSEQFGFEVDTSGKDCSRLCFLAHDPLCIYNIDAPEIDWDRDGWLAAIAEQEASFAEAASQVYTGNVDVSALDFVDPNDLDYNQWLSVITACKIAGLSPSQADAWSRRGGVRYTLGEVESRWHGLNLSVSWGAVVNLAKRNGYVPMRSSIDPRSAKILKKSAVDFVFDALQRSREIIRTAFRATAKVFGIRSDTGVGKTYESRSYVIETDRSLLMSTPTTELASEVSFRYSEKMDTFQHHGLSHGWSDLDSEFTRDHAFLSKQILCIYAPEAEAYRMKGGNMYKVFCSGCHLHSECVQYGYLSQPEQARSAQAVILPFGQAFTSPTFKAFTKDYLQSPFHESKVRMALVDDTDVVDLFIKLSVSKARLQAIRAMWGESAAGNFAADILRCLEVEQDVSAIRAVINYVLEMGQSEQVSWELTQVKTEAGIMSLDDAVLGGYFNRDVPESMPEVYGAWGLFEQLYAAFKHYQRDVDMPISYADDVLEFYVPPVLHEGVERFCIMSATLNPLHLKKAFGADAEVYDAPPTEWHPDAQVFQLSTHTLSRRMTYEYEGDTPVALSSLGQRIWSLMEQGVRAHPDKRHALITYKQVVEWLSLEVQELDLVTGHFGGMVGLDAKFEDCDVFWILFTPFIPPSALETKCRILFGDEEEPLSFEWQADGTFADPRVQSVYEAVVHAELIQAVGRARLVLYGKIVIILSAVHLQGITDRDVTELFTFRCFDQCEGDFSKMATHNEKTDQAFRDCDVEAIMALTGCSRSQAYHLTAQRRAEIKTLVKGKVFEWFDAGVAPSDIVDRLEADPDVPPKFKYTKRHVQRLIEERSF